VENTDLAHRYQEVTVRTANPMQLGVMLYDAAICSLLEAREHLERKNIEGRVRSANKSLAIISELQSSLNFKDGGDIAVSLNRLYGYMKMRIFAANVQQSPMPLKEVESLLETLRSAWRTLAAQVREAPEISKSQALPESAVIGAAAQAAGMQIRSFNLSI